jgi:hypothetical protein
MFTFVSNFFLRKVEGFWECYGSFLRIIGPLAEFHLGPSVYFDVIFLHCHYTMKLSSISVIFIIFLLMTLLFLFVNEVVLAPYTEKNKHFEGLFHQYFVGVY